MKFQILVCHADKSEDEAWWETYDKEEVKTEEEVNRWGKETVDWYNSTLRLDEKSRRFIRAEVIDNGTKKHRWEKMNSFTIEGPSGVLYDRFECERCGITGKRYGFDEIVRDGRWKSKKYDVCSGV